MTAVSRDDIMLLVADMAAKWSWWRVEFCRVRWTAGMLVTTKRAKGDDQLALR